jgi:type II secretory pathway pseudopilin PulG
MRFGARSNRTKKPSVDRSQGGFTLAEVLAALLFMGIVIPVAVEGLRVASLAGEVAERKSQAARVAERLINESLVASNWAKSVQKGTLQDGLREYRWTLRNETWSQDGNLYAPRLLSVEVTYAVRNRDYVVSVSTLTPNILPP